VDGDDAVFGTETNSTLINKGQISASGVGSAGVVFFGAGGVIRNSGEILSAESHAVAIFSTSGETLVTNLKGGIIASPRSQAALVGDNGNETIVNAGRIGAVDATFGIFLTVDLGAGDDHFTNFKKIGNKVVSGALLGFADLGDGNDTFLGARKKEAVIDGGGSDTYKLGGGGDTYIAKNGGSDGNDIVSGGSGIDTFDVGGSVFNGVSINIDNKDHSFGMAFVPANTARGDDISGGINTDTITGFEHVGGGESNDIIFGNKAANVVFANSGADGVVGFGGNDYLIGGLGADFLIGGKGADRLDGQEDADTFAFVSVKDSTPAKAGRDVILDFEDALDIINLDAIDANARNGVATNEEFQFLGVDVAFASGAGGLRVATKDFGWIIQGEVNGDKKADFAIKVLDASHTISWSGGDFDL
ncbi:MAG TPA: calcium-binding protein, partial [Methyloceanibacter sp.]